MSATLKDGSTSGGMLTLQASVRMHLPSPSVSWQKWTRIFRSCVVALHFSETAPFKEPVLLRSCVCLPYKTKSRGIRKSSVVIADMGSFGREVKLLEELGRYGNTSRRPDDVALFLVLQDPIPVVRRRHVCFVRLIVTFGSALVAMTGSDLCPPVSATSINHSSAADSEGINTNLGYTSGVRAHQAHAQPEPTNLPIEGRGVIHTPKPTARGSSGSFPPI